MAFLVTFLLALAAPMSTPTPAPAGTGVAAGTGTVSGRVTIVKNGAALADASNCVVWIEGAHRPAAVSAAALAAAPVRPHHVEMKSQGKKFVPRIVAVEKNSEVEFPNVDPI